ncbi:surface protease GP63, partial [Trypanosoma cruzi]
MAHALGFAHPHMASRSMVRNAIGVRGRALSVVVNSTNAAMAARKHHDCDDIYGMGLQDQNGDGSTLESHCSQRHAKDELMAPIGGAGDHTELTLAAPAELGYMRMKWGMAEPMRWCRKSGCRLLLLQSKRSAPNVSEYCYMLCDVGVPVKRCASDRYSRGWYLGSIHERSAKHSKDRCHITDPALDVRDIEAVIWGGEYLSAMPGDRPSLWSLDTLPTNTTDARDPEETYLSAAMHAALRCLVMQVRLRVTEEGNVRWSHARTERRLRGPLDRTMREALLAVATRRCARYLPPAAVSFRWFCVTARRGCGAGRSHRHLLDKDCEGASVPVTESIDPGRGTHTKDVVTAIPEMNLLLQGPWRPSVLLFCWNEARTKETACRPAVNSC